MEEAGGDTLGGGAVEGWETVAESGNNVTRALGGAESHVTSEDHVVGRYGQSGGGLVLVT